MKKGLAKNEPNRKPQFSQEIEPKSTDFLVDQTITALSIVYRSVEAAVDHSL